LEKIYIPYAELGKHKMTSQEANGKEARKLLPAY
jgi:hypothetical protein